MPEHYHSTSIGPWFVTERGDSAQNVLRRDARDANVIGVVTWITDELSIWTFGAAKPAAKNRNCGKPPLSKVQCGAGEHGGGHLLIRFKKLSRFRSRRAMHQDNQRKMTRTVRAAHQTFQFDLLSVGKGDWQ
jgi:hypothetical protein